ncbi:Hypothetical predicted protein [Pelobates cultripes]|uniref:Uncharacterized protein n=1 Tax=Pelobates cultripes TaxID=61616 RepID=A0AAD1S017_PELCU|nr:Hypothetical predicted protein [Pelobates cultripes]
MTGLRVPVSPYRPRLSLFPLVQLERTYMPVHMSAFRSQLRSVGLHEAAEAGDGSHPNLGRAMSRLFGRFADFLGIRIQTTIADEVCRSLSGILKGFRGEQTKIVSLSRPVNTVPWIRDYYSNN